MLPFSRVSELVLLPANVVICENMLTKVCLHCVLDLLTFMSPESPLQNLPLPIVLV